MFQRASRGDDATDENPNQRETSFVPLFLKSSLRIRTWLAVGGVLLLVGCVLVLAAITTSKIVGAVGVVVLVAAIVFLCGGLGVMTEKVRLAPDHVARVTALSRSKIAWSQVELYSTGLLTTREPVHVWYCLEGAGHRIRFRTRLDDYGDLDALLRSRCPRAFLQDYVTGWITPPAAGGRAGADIPRRFGRVAARSSRRYALLAVGQAILLPGVVVLAVPGMIRSRLTRLPLLYGPSDIAANFRRAANARRSLGEFLRRQASP